MKILLINPPRSPVNGILKHAPEEARAFIHKKLIGPPLGLLTIATAVNDHDVSLIDMKGEYDLNPDTPSLDIFTTQLLEAFHPDIVGVTVITSEFDYAMQIFSVCKKFNPEILTIAGGLHATLCTEDFYRPEVDIVCPGQAAGVFRKIIECGEKKESLLHIGGILINGPDGLKLTPSPVTPWEAAQKDYIMPDRHLLKKWISTYKVGNSPYPSTYIFTSLGCPYKCTFCSIWCQFNGEYRQRHTESIIEELKTLEDYPVVRFADANTIVDVQFIDRLFDRILEERISKTFIMDIRTDIAANNPQLIEKLAKAGLKVVICGFESCHNEELKQYNKGSEAKMIGKSIKVFHDNDIMIRGNYVIPPSYKADDFQAIAAYAASHEVVYAGYTVLTPMPGTVLYQSVKDSITDYDYRKYNFFNSIMKTALPLEEFYEKTARLWLIKKGNDVI